MKPFSRPAGLRWRRAVKADLPALGDFLAAEEERRVGFSGRLLRVGASGGTELQLPAALRGAVWVIDAEGAGDRGPGRIAGAVLCHPSRLAFPILPDDASADRALALLAGPFSPASVLGMKSDVVRYESVLGLEPQVSVEYRLMTREASGPQACAGMAPYPGLSLRRASISDLDALMGLQEAYEREEVLTAVHEFNRAACRASLGRALERQLIYLAVEDGVFVGKAGTNARGFRVDQVGGVYTLPERRGRGVAGALMEALLAEVEGAGKGASLFVKPGNAPARALYRRLGFGDVGDYRADYFEA